MIVCFHEINSSKIFICRIDTFEVFAGNIHKAGKPGAVTYKNRFKAMEEFGFGPNVMKNTKVCSQCGQAVNADTAYCSGCGAKLRQMTADFPA